VTMNVKIPAQAELGRGTSVVPHDLALARHVEATEDFR